MSVHSTLLLNQDHIQELIANHQLLLIDKPRDKSSHDMVNQVRFQTGIKKVGHAGTLDPMATGLLLILVGREATRFQDQLMGMDKEYQFTAVLGLETDTYDSDGQVVKQWSWEDVKDISRDALSTVVESFVGEYDQQVPAYSAVKFHGKRLYDLARANKVTELPSRSVRINSIVIDRFDKDEELQKVSFSCTVKCGSGTYIRSLAVDIGRALGNCATVTRLRRVSIGQFSLQTPTE